jgi:hypothetical protein
MGTISGMGTNEANAKGAELVGLVVASAVSAIPLVGGPLTVVASYFGNMPMQRRFEKLLDKLQVDVTQLYEQLGSVDSTMLESEPFNAALTRVVRVSLETASDSKREALRNALLNGYIKGGFSERDRFLALVAEYESPHLVVLEALQSLMKGRDRALDHAAESITRHLRDEVEQATVWTCLNDLVADGLVSRIVDGEVSTVNVGFDKWNQWQTRQALRETHFHLVSERGETFLAFVASPLDD